MSIPDYISIKQGHLLSVKIGFWTSGDDKDYGFKCKRFIPKGTIIEIRYAYAWHFRTTNNQYFHANEKILIAKCEFFGSVDEGIKFGNKHDLMEILDQGLYNKASDFQLVLKLHKKEIK
jgi:hypothetical protein